MMLLLYKSCSSVEGESIEFATALCIVWYATCPRNRQILYKVYINSHLLTCASGLQSISERLIMFPKTIIFKANQNPYQTHKIYKTK